MNSKPRILLLGDFPLSSLGDTYNREGSSWLPQIAKSFESISDLDIHWLVLTKQTKIYYVLSSSNQHYHVIPYWGLSRSLLTFRIREWLQFRKIIKLINPDLIHCWGTENPYSVALFATNKPSILSIQGIIHTIWNLKVVRGWHWFILKILEPISLRRANFITCESNWGIKKLSEIFQKQNVIRIEYGVNNNFFTTSWKPNFEKKYFIFVGLLSWGKGVDVIHKMLSLYPNRNWDMHFVGDGEYAPALKSLSSNGVIMHGVLPPLKVAEVMRCSIGLVLPTRADTSPNVVKEARVIGLPVISTSNGGQASYIQHGEDGFIIDSEDPHEWYSYLDKLAGDEQLCQKFGKVNYDYYRSILHPDVTARAFVKLYNELLNKKK